MQPLSYLKWPLIIFISGYIIRITGIASKIRHWPGADQALTIGSAIMIAGLAFVIVKLLVYKKKES